MSLRRVLLVSTLVALLVPANVNAVGAEARSCEWQRGFSFWSHTGRYNSEEAFASLRSLRATGANFVSPIVTLYVDNAYDSTVKRRASTTADAELITFVDKAHELGLKVFLKIHVDAVDGTWRGFFDPADKETWFATYAAFLDHYASLAASQNIEGLAVGSELVGLSGPQYTGQWKDVIARVRARYPGFLTYSANWGGGIADKWPDRLEEFTKIEFWPDLDYLGISAYFELSKQEYPSREELFGGWDRWYYSRIAPFQAAQGKPVLITEVGYKSTVGAAGRPWDQDLEKGIDLQTQAELYEVFFRYWSGVPWLHGVYFWRWSPQLDDVGSPQTDYLLQNKPAEKTVATWFNQPGWVVLRTWLLLDDLKPVPTKQHGPLPFLALNSGVARTWAFLSQLESCQSEGDSGRSGNIPPIPEGSGKR